MTYSIYLLYIYCIHTFMTERSTMAISILANFSPRHWYCNSKCKCSGHSEANERETNRSANGHQCRLVRVTQSLHGCCSSPRAPLESTLRIVEAAVSDTPSLSNASKACTQNCDAWQKNGDRACVTARHPTHSIQTMRCSDEAHDACMQKHLTHVKTQHANSKYN
jgi:hypothetical protein